MAKTFNYTVLGAKELRRYLARVGPEALPVVTGVLFEQAHEGFAESQRIVPHADGILAGSGLVKPPEISATSISITLGYGGAASAYAERQHEDLTLSHPDPRNPNSRPTGQAKYLEEPMRKRIPIMRQQIKERLAKVMKP